MTAATPQHRKPLEASPYAALHKSEPAAEPDIKPALPAQPSTAPPVDPFLQQEAEKLAQLRTALWGAFQAAPEAGLPSALIDLTIAYTGALRLELSMMGWHRVPCARVAGAGPPAALADRR